MEGHHFKHLHFSIIFHSCPYFLWYFADVLLQGICRSFRSTGQSGSRLRRLRRPASVPTRMAGCWASTEQQFTGCSSKVDAKGHWEPPKPGGFEDPVLGSSNGSMGSHEEQHILNRWLRLAMAEPLRLDEQVTKIMTHSSGLAKVFSRGKAWKCPKHGIRLIYFIYFVCMVSIIFYRYFYSHSDLYCLG